MSLSYVCAIFCFMHARALQLFLGIFKFLNSVLELAVSLRFNFSLILDFLVILQAFHK